jgi:hypothetical protein
MATDKNPTGKSYDQARQIAEKALDAYVKNDDRTGDELIRKAKTLDEHAVRDIAKELEEDAASEHDVGKLNTPSNA